MTEDELAKRVLRKIDRLFHTLDRLEDKIDDLHDHLMLIMDEMFGPEEEGASDQTAVGAVAKKKDETEKVYNA